MPDTAPPSSPAPHNPLEQQSHQRMVILRFVRMAFFVLITTVALLLTLQSQRKDSELSALAQDWWVPVSIAILLFCVAMIVDLVTPNKKLATISAIFFGLVAGMLATAALSAVIDLLIAAWVQRPDAISAQVAMVKVMLGMTLCYLGVSSVLQTQDDFRLVVPYVEFAKQIRGVRPNLLDTSVLIDARIAELCATGILQSPLIIPKFVIAELQLLADSQDKLKRARGRRGLDIVTRLQRMGTIEVLIDESPVTSRAVDQMLVELAAQLSARIVTTDLGLTRVAQIQGVTAINLHDVSNSMRPALVPGDQIQLRLVKGGEQPHQGVGYLDDGTMVVVENGASGIGQEIAVLVTASMQTTAGRLVFARPVEPIAQPTSVQPVPAVVPAPDAAPAEEPDADMVSEPAPAAEIDKSPDKPRSGPLGPKSIAGRRSPTARNPRRWPPAE